MIDDVKIGQRIKELRAAKGMTQKELACALAVDYTSVSQYERGQRRPSFEVLAKLSRVLEVSVDHLLGISEALQYVSLQGLTESQVASVLAAVNEMIRINRHIYEPAE